MKILSNKYLLPFLFVSGSLAVDTNFVSIDGLSPYNNKYLINEPTNISGEEKKSIFDIKSISSMYIDDVTNPKIIDENEFNFDTSPECLDLVKAKYSCIKLQSKDFDSFCKRLNSTECSELNDEDKSIISGKCNISLYDAEEFKNTINKLINAKKFFCIKKSDNSTISTSRETTTNNSNSNNSEPCEEEDGYCPITISLQKGYLKLIKEVEEKELNLKKRKRSPVISNVNSFLPSSNIDAQIVKKRLVEDLKKNCNYTVCQQKLVQYLNEIRDDYSYFNVIYQYKVNDDSLRDNILDILREYKCASISRISKSSHILLIIIGILYLLF